LRGCEAGCGLPQKDAQWEWVLNAVPGHDQAFFSGSKNLLDQRVPFPAHWQGVPFVPGLRVG
jgi:hypothetical protein